MKIKCKEGWLLAESSTDKSLVPFFIKVLGRNIVYSIKDAFSNTILKYANEAESDIAVSYGISSINYKKDDYDITLYSNNTFKLVKEIPLSDQDLIIYNDMSVLTTELTLPIELKKDSGLSINNIINTSDSNIAKSFTSVSVNTMFDDIQNITLRLINVGSEFSANRNTEAYTNSFVTVTITGNLSD